MLLHPTQRLLPFLGLGLLLSLPAAAQDDDFDFLDYDEEETGEDEGDEGDEADDAGILPSDDEALPEGQTEDDFGFDTEPTEAPEDFDFSEPIEDDTEVDTDLEGVDNARIYRQKQDEVEDLPPEEEAIEWERYLREYPNSQFRSRIEARIDRLTDAMYNSTIETTEIREEAGKAELHFAQPFALENIDPRSKIRAGVEFGLPGYLAPILDFEYAFVRNFSVHGGVRGRYGGTSFEPGVRWAMVKSARTHTLLTLIADARVNLNPAYVGFRPQLAFGQRVPLDDDLFLDAQLQVGTELVSYGVFSPRAVGGANVSIAPGDTVRFYFETSTYMKDMFWDQGGTFRFNVISFGVKFLERNKNQLASRFEIGGGAMAPYTTNYWSFHSGAVGLDANYYLK
ncbi:MAG: hypothetical protein D6798_03460 [Deltaproteobacteria bacterium]|nr:MAG: hypothetical protein D6798_03460 [Deltaproteobacteria bacterium]